MLDSIKRIADWFSRNEKAIIEIMIIGCASLAAFAWGAAKIAKALGGHG